MSTIQTEDMNGAAPRERSVERRVRLCGNANGTDNMNEKSTPLTQRELLATLRVLDRLDQSKLLTDDEETALAVVSEAIVALSDPLNLHEYPGLADRLRLRVKVWYEGPNAQAD